MQKGELPSTCATPTLKQQTMIQHLLPKRISMVPANPNIIFYQKLSRNKFSCTLNNEIVLNPNSNLSTVKQGQLHYVLIPHTNQLISEANETTEYSTQIDYSAQLLRINMQNNALTHASKLTLNIKFYLSFWSSSLSINSSSNKFVHCRYIMYYLRIQRPQCRCIYMRSSILDTIFKSR